MSWSASSSTSAAGTSVSTAAIGSNSASASSISSPLETPASSTHHLSSAPCSEASPTSSQPSERHSSTSSSFNTSANADAAEQNKERIIVPSACVQCRSKHLKCDGLTPCSRCSANSFECIFVRSRRGFKGPRKNATQGKIPAAPGAGASCPMINPNAGRGPHIPTGLVTPPEHRLQTLPQPVNLPAFDTNRGLTSYENKQLLSGLDLRERCLEAFFFHFHPAHPFLLPRAEFIALRKEKSMDFLLAAMRYVGSFYTLSDNSMALGMEAERAIYHADCPKDAFRVQAMLILAIGLDGYTYQEKALQILLDAEDLAMELGMNRRNFAFLNSNGSPIMEESWRRTWWELYLVDGLVAGVHQKSDFRMKDMPADVLLPCEEKEYVTGFIPQPNKIEDFDDESFDTREFTFSSYTYRIAAIRNLGKVIAARMLQPEQDSESILRLDAYLVNWRLHLPGNKKSFINNEGQLDEMLFQAHMITEATTVVLHREFSELDSSVAKDVTSCAPYKSIAPGESYNIHAAKMVQAAQDISKLISLPVPLIKHTHFFTCVTTLGSIVHLTCWSTLMPYMQDDDLKQQLRLCTGALKTLWQVWPSAGKAFGQVKGVAQEIFAAKKLAVESGYWASFSQDEVARVMSDDQNIMTELELLK
ncbi:hypothetical protein BJ875DRAFT_243226 [Amylocarpus encephaloides]|uniref:Zn(2)-C6 fungal-type domain-containing protein n=1 Tax=Amylocarpus encephaloides TaxID=45428 RepID=A0A9P7YSQ2_9HELO|nr:hypothetical protein BJ875DRAFT_243226 [Amylocarpus encephaloides]